MNTKQHVQLSEAERQELEALVRQGQLKNRTLKRALGLLALDDGATLQGVAQHQRVSAVTVASWRDNYQARGLASLHDQPRPGRPPLLDGVQRAQITALACSTPPEGHARWDLRLLAEKVVELEYCETISHTQVGKILKKTNSSPTASVPGVSAK